MQRALQHRLSRQLLQSQSQSQSLQPQRSFSSALGSLSRRQPPAQAKTLLRSGPAASSSLLLLRTQTRQQYNRPTQYFEQPIFAEVSQSVNQ